MHVAHFMWPAIALATSCSMPPVMAHTGTDTQDIFDGAVDTPIDSPIDAATPYANMVMIAGQSNVGVGPGQETSLLTIALPSDYNTPFTAIQTAKQLASSNTDPIPWMGPYADSPIEPYTAANGSDQFGVELSMGRYLQASQTSPAWFEDKFAVASSTLQVNWRPAATYPTKPSGSPNLFSQFLTYCQAEEVAQHAHLVVLIWIQGESDAQNATDAANYATNMSALWTAFQAVYPNTILIFDKLSSHTGQAYANTVRAQQDTFAASATNVVEINVDDLAMVGGTGVHFTANSLVALGRRFGKQVLTSLGIDAAPVAGFDLAPSSLTVAFTDTSTDDDGPVTSWSWDFGDGSSSTTQNPTHTYATSGPFTVSLAVGDGTDTSPSISKTVLPAWTVDSTRGVGVPTTATEWTATGDPVPADLWTMQEASGNALDKISTHNVVISGGAAWTYQDTVTGMTRKGLTVVDGSSTARALYSSAPSAATHSILYLDYVDVLTVPTVERSVMSYGGLDVRITTAGMLRAVNGTPSAIGTISPVGRVVPVFLLHDITNNRHIVYTPFERLVVPYATSTATFLSWGKGGVSSAHATDTYAAVWFDADAERTDVQIRDEYALLGWDVTW